MECVDGILIGGICGGVRHDDGVLGEVGKHIEEYVNLFRGEMGFALEVDVHVACIRVGK